MGTLRLCTRVLLPCVGGLAAAVLGLAAPAAADVAVAPTQAAQGDGARLTFKVANDDPARSISAVRLVLPADTPIAEAYPVSIPNWGPRITMRELPTALPGLHGGKTTQTAASIEWKAVRGAALAPGQSVDLPVSLGPMPRLRQVRFSAVQTYTDGTTRTAQGPLAVTLTPGSGTPGSGAGHGGHTAAGGAAGPARPVAATSPAPADGPGGWTVAGWVVAAVALVVAVVTVVRTRRSGSTPEPAGQGSEQSTPAASASTGQPVAAGRWTYRQAG